MDLKAFVLNNYEVPIIEISPGNLCLLPGDLPCQHLLGYFEGKFRTLEKNTTTYIGDRDWYIVYDRKEEFLLNGQFPLIKSLHVFEEAIQRLVDKDYVWVKKKGQTWYYTLGEGYCRAKRQYPYKYSAVKNVIPEYNKNIYYNEVTKQTEGDVEDLYDIVWEVVEQRDDVDITPSYFDKVFSYKFEETAFYHQEEEDSRKYFNLMVRDILYDWEEDHNSFKALKFDIMYYQFVEAIGFTSWYRPKFTRANSRQRWEIYWRLKDILKEFNTQNISVKEYGKWFTEKFGGGSYFNMSWAIRQDTVSAFINNRNLQQENYKTV